MLLFLGLWSALTEVFDGVTLRGCAFHWAQAVQGKAKKLGLVTAAGLDPRLSKLLRRGLALQFMPSSHIPQIFQQLRLSSQRYEEGHHIHRYLDYLDQQWISSSTFPPSSWSQYGATIRTNNDLEGWHRSFNVSLGAHPRLYRFLKKIATDAAKTMDVIAARDFSRNSEATTQKEGRIKTIAERYLRKEITASKMLDCMSHIYRSK